ncbi:hypothetical protein COV16_02390 [Candidatus Woesearchaeota archaeon CG10_big_fil_rev_8_21_14_0_10_34_8]|nr:MAG: hypothetical protein COV16_02390 [Candidatus Woesearchaeota archaeon CG10_big_fil_rev_8_21_14_0_10_34_8]
MANKLNWKALAISLGVLWGVYLFLAALFEMNNASFWWWNQPTWEFLVAAYPLMNASFGGAIIGLILGFVCGAVCGGLIAWLYNWADKRWK